MTKNKFPKLAVILLLLSGSWILNDFGLINVDLPWFPIILFIIAIGWIIDSYN